MCLDCLVKHRWACKLTLIKLIPVNKQLYTLSTYSYICLILQSSYKKGIAMKILIWFTAITLFTVMTACSYGPDSPKGFSLPEGNMAIGEKVFLQYQCSACHALKGHEDNSLIKEFDTPIPLGGSSSTVKTYAQLVTSIINPSHKLAHRNKSVEEKIINDDGSSKMRVFNDVMTVQELIDLVAFLQPKYEVKPITYTHYGQYRML